MNNPPLGSNLTDLCREIILEWSRLSDLADFAERGHGYGSDSGGIQYPEDLDEYERLVEGTQIPEGFLRVYSYGQDDVLVPQSIYLRTLMDVLANAGFAGDMAKVQALLDRLNP
ncbi:hypothetical protein SAMN05518854_105454 [Variovorax sp. YR266]|uniref:hypothetical protein n=1 Tax=Variovorax sp. YR266 TaxID=1884386 RepID=UPI0008954652|nr:hypothetical protein [Variovorax sp. YR266]SDZ39283.1 hypothetical protein SAMN05518854_105454 [Variovorax sp. YR266]